MVEFAPHYRHAGKAGIQHYRWRASAHWSHIFPSPFVLATLLRVLLYANRIFPCPLLFVSLFDGANIRKPIHIRVASKTSLTGSIYENLYIHIASKTRQIEVCTGMNTYIPLNRCTDQYPVEVDTGNAHAA